MNLYQISAIVTCGAAALFLLLFAITSFCEQKPRAAWLSLGGFVSASVLLTGGVVLWQPSDIVLGAITAGVWIFSLLYFFSQFFEFCGFNYFHSNIIYV